MSGRTSGRALGVGIAGCGAITQACHLPALASLPDLFRVTHCNDVDGDVATRVAARLGGARASTDLEDLLNDTAVDVVAVCVPDRFHADVVGAACEAGKKAVLCEKPLAGTEEDVDRIVTASEASGVPVLVATMHRHDPVLSRLMDRWGDLPERASLVRSTMYVPPNGWLVDLATESPARAPAAPKPAPDPAVLAPILPGAWASTTFVHHMPLMRLCFSGPPDAISARALGVAGSQVSLRWGDRLAQLSGIAYSFGGLDWSFELWSPAVQARIDFPVSFLPGHTAVGRLWRATGDHVEEIRVSSQDETGYRAEWRHLARVVAGEEAPLTPAGAAKDDVVLSQLIDAAGRTSPGLAPFAAAS
jgi:predicted dehydrogenase